MNFWSTKISPKMPTAQSSQDSDPPALRLKYGGVPELEGNGVHQQNPKHGNTAYQVEAGNPRVLANGAGFGRLRNRRQRVELHG